MEKTTGNELIVTYIYIITRDSRTTAIDLRKHVFGMYCVFVYHTIIFSVTFECTAFITIIICLCNNSHDQGCVSNSEIAKFSMLR